MRFSGAAAAAAVERERKGRVEADRLLGGIIAGVCVLFARRLAAGLVEVVCSCSSLVPQPHRPKTR